MVITISGKQLTVTEEMRNKIEKQLRKLDDFLEEDDQVNVLVRTVKNDRIIEVTIPLKGRKIVRAEECDRDFYAAADKVGDSLSRQLRRVKEKREGRRKVSVDTFVPEDSEPEIFIRKKTVELSVCTPEDAAEEMDLLDHSFHLFLMDDGSRHGTPAVVYRRKDGGVGLIMGSR